MSLPKPWPGARVICCKGSRVRDRIRDPETIIVTDRSYIDLEDRLDLTHRPTKLELLARLCDATGWDFAEAYDSFTADDILAACEEVSQRPGFKWPE